MAVVLNFCYCTSGVLIIALQSFASGGNYTACFSMSKPSFSLSHAYSFFIWNVMTDIKVGVRKPQVTSPGWHNQIKNGVAKDISFTPSIKRVLSACSSSFRTLHTHTHTHTYTHTHTCTHARTHRKNRAQVEKYQSSRLRSICLWSVFFCTHVT